MTTYTAKDDLPSVPKLEADGSNWVTFKTRLDWALADKQVDGHLTSSTLAPDPNARLPDFDDLLAKWEKDERRA